MRPPAVLWIAAVLLSSASPSPAADAGTVERRIDVDGVARSYLIHVPATWDRAAPIPVLFVLHGAGSNAEDMVAGTGFDAMSEETHVLVVYPQAPAGTKRFETDPPTGRTSADVRFLDVLLGRLRERFRVDDRRVFATGFSNGAALCYRLAAERPEVFAAIAPVAGYLPDLERAAPITPVPLLHVHGTADRRVAPPTIRGDANAPVPRWARWNGCTAGPDVATLPDTGRLVVRRASYTGPTTRSDAQLLLVEGQDHVWAGGPGGPISKAVLAFLLAHPKSAPTPAVAPAPTPGTLPKSPR